MIDRRRVLATAHDLARFHTERAAIYRVLSELICVPPTHRALDALRQVLDEARRVASPILRDLTQVADSKDGSRLLAEYFAQNDGVALPLQSSCVDPLADARIQAFGVCRRLEDASAATELVVLSKLAERSARAMLVGDWSGAAALSELQHRFLDQHAAKCLDRLAEVLDQTHCPLYLRAAEVMRNAIADDLALLDRGPLMLANDRALPAF